MISVSSRSPAVDVLGPDRSAPVTRIMKTAIIKISARMLPETR